MRRRRGVSKFKWWKGAIAAWSLAEKDSSGTTIYDLVGTTDGTNITTPVFTTDQNGKSNRAISLDGTNGRINLGVEKPNDLTGDITIIGWIKLTSVGTSDYILSNGKLSLTGTTTNRIRLASDGSNYRYTANNAVLDDTWTHIAVTRTSAGVVNFCINGQPNGTADQDSGTPTVSAATTYISGAFRATGAFSDIGIFAGIKSDAWLANQYKKTS